MDKREQSALIEMLRAGKRERDAAGTPDARSDQMLRLYEAGIFDLPRGVDIMTIDPATYTGRRNRDSIANAERVTDDEFRGRRGGEPARNQFGASQVHPASPKQVAYIRRLIAERDVEAYNTTVARPLAIPADLDTISKTSASTLIEKLMACPVRGGGTQVPSATHATEPQMRYLRKLMAERDRLSLVPADRTTVDWIEAGGTPTKRDASALIEVLKGTSLAAKVSSNGFTRDRQRSDEAELESGMYRHPESGEVLKVYKAVHGSGKMCAKRLVVLAEPTINKRGKQVRAEFEYLGLATRFVKGHVRMTIEDAKEFGAIYGVCCQCGATLTDERSIEAGIGPVCAGKI